MNNTSNITGDATRQAVGAQVRSQRPQAAVDRRAARIGATGTATYKKNVAGVGPASESLPQVAKQNPPN